MRGLPDRFVRPLLAACEIRVTDEGRCLLLRGAGRELEIDVDEGRAGDVVSMLEGLRTPVFTALEPFERVEFAHLFKILDQFGWIVEGDTSGQAVARADQDILAATIRDATTWLAGAVVAARRGDLACKPDRLKQALSGIAAGKELRSAAGSLAGITFDAAIRAWRRSSPAAPAVLARAAADAVAGERFVTVAPIALELPAVCDVGAVRRQVWAACLLLVQACADEGAPRHFRHIPSNVAAQPGINLAILAEASIEGLLSDLGPSPLLEVLADASAARRGATGIFVHQHFVTIRYLESVLSLLRWRLRPGLRQVAFSYLLEEQGHEVHERAACRSLGLSDEEIDLFAPLPFFEVYCDVLCDIAERDPLGFLMSVIAAEGMPGQRKPLAGLLARQGMDDPSIAAHTDLDEQLDHSQFPRSLLRQVPWVGEVEARAALSSCLFAIEISQAAWRQLAAWASDTKLPSVPEPFALSHHDAAKLLSR